MKQTAFTILKRGHQLPPERLSELKQELKGYLNIPSSTELTQGDLERVCEMQEKQENPNYKSHEQLLVEIIRDDEEKLYEFVRMWRYHFVNTMQPKFLPPHWDPKRPLDASGEGQR